MTSAPTSSPRARRVDDDVDSSLPYAVGLVVAIMIHGAAFTGFAAAGKYNFFGMFSAPKSPSSLAAPDATAADPGKPKPPSPSEPKRDRAVEDEERRKLMQTLLPPRKPDITFGKEGSESTSIAWISYDDYQDLIAAKGKTQQPALQSQVDPLAGAPIRPDPTPPQPQARIAQTPQNRAVLSGPMPKSGEMKPHYVAPASPPSPPQPNQVASREPSPAPPVAQEAAPTPAPAPTRESKATEALKSALKVPDPISPPTPRPVPEAPKVREAASSPVQGHGHDIDVGRQQPGPALPANAIEAPGGTGAASEQVAIGPIPSVHQGQATVLPPSAFQPTPMPAAPKPSEPPPAQPAQPAAKITAPPAPANPPKPTPAPTQAQTPPTPPHPATPAASAGNPAPIATGPNPGAVDSESGAPSGPARPTGAPKSDREASPVSLTDSPLPARPGRVIAGKGIEIKTAFPQFSAIALSTSIPTNPEVKVVFDRDGTVIDAQITKSSTYPNIDGPILASLYKWKAAGPMLQEINAPISVTIKIILIDESD